MGTGSVDDRYSSGDSYCRRCLSPFWGVTPGYRGKRGQWEMGMGTEPTAFFRSFNIRGGSEPVPISHSASMRAGHTTGATGGSVSGAINHGPPPTQWRGVCLYRQPLS